MKIKLILLLILTCTASFAQPTIYRSPVDFPVSLSGNIGEARSNHFHTGLDIRGGANFGAPIYSVIDGYVSRIFVSPYGYGNALYVTNINGTMAVYAHLDRFVDKIGQWVKRQQYAKKSFAVDLYPSKDLFAVQQGDRIAYLGNSGSSGGPHLHFEIRDGRTMNPLNIGKMKVLNVADNISPVVRKIHLYEQDTVLGVPIFKHSSTISINKNKVGDWELSDTVLYFDRPAYLAYEVTDYKNGSLFTMGLYSIVQKVDNKQNFSYRLDDISFATTRYVNAFTQYDLTTRTRNDVVRAYVAPNNLLNNYVDKSNDGVIIPPMSNGMRKEVKTILFDDNNNSSEVSFYLEKRSKAREAVLLDNNVMILTWDRDYTFKDGDMTVVIPAKSLYENVILPFSSDTQNYIVGDSKIPLQSYITLKVNKLIEPSLQSKTLFLNAKGRSAGGSYNDGQMTLQTRNFGVYSIGYDTIPPVATKLKTGKENKLLFKISDNLSGIDTYQLLIDNEWALAEYDAKTNTLKHQFVRSTGATTDHKITLKVTDGKGNTITNKSNEKW